MKRRKVLQLHLSTALVLMVLAGGLVWLNVRSRPVRLPEALDEMIKDSPVEEVKYFTQLKIRGWPCNFQVFNMAPEFQDKLSEAVEASEGIIQVEATGVDREQLVKNILVALAILGMVGAGFEWWVRRRGNANG